MKTRKNKPTFRNNNILYHSIAKTLLEEVDCSEVLLISKIVHLEAVIAVMICSIDYLYNKGYFVACDHPDDHRYIGAQDAQLRKIKLEREWQIRLLNKYKHRLKLLQKELEKDNEKKS